MLQVSAAYRLARWSLKAVYIAMHCPHQTESTFMFKLQIHGGFGSSSSSVLEKVFETRSLLTCSVNSLMCQKTLGKSTLTEDTCIQLPVCC
jgi:hypothetical protein